MAEKKLRVIFEPPRSAAFNMARDSYFLELTSKSINQTPVLTIYSFNQPSISIGKFQDEKELKKMLLKDVEIVRRPTGGRAVLHADDLTYSFVSSSSEDFPEGRVRETYKRVNEVLKTALRLLQVKVDDEISERKKALPKAKHNCFATIFISDLSAFGKKICGSALTWKKSAFLQHGSIYLKFPEKEFKELFGEETLDLIKQNVISISELQPHVDFESLGQAIFQAFKTAGYEPFLKPLTDEELDAISKYEPYFIVK